MIEPANQPGTAASLPPLTVVHVTILNHHRENVAPVGMYIV